MRTFRQVSSDAFNDDPKRDGILISIRGSIILDSGNTLSDLKGPSGDFFHPVHWQGDSGSDLFAYVRTWDSESLIQ